MTPCPDPEVLERYAEGALDGAARADVAAHVTACAGCRALLDDVSANLPLASSVREALRRIDRAAHAEAPERIGAFRVLRELGRGGMGVVYLAEQERPRRQVALKVLHPGGSPAALRRFEHEANLLAHLKHPGIAQVYEAGIADGRPYLAMEHVQGDALDVFAQRRGLSPRERLALVADVCDAAHHAHVRGVVHRDLKPANILVEEIDAGADPGGTAGADRRHAAARPKVLDFGVARATAADLMTMTVGTEAGQLLGTIPFMSPEQLAGDPAKVDARSDVYALGVIAHWLLAGDFPYSIRDCSLVEAARRIQEDAPVPLASVAPRLKGDAEVIVATALAKDPAQRYQSASEMAADLRRFLADEPILARPPGAAEQLRRFARRHRALAGAAAVVAGVLAVAAVGGSWLAVRATRAERAARAQLARAESIHEFLEGMLSSSNPYEGEGNAETTVPAILARAAAELDGGRFSGQPEVEGAVRKTLGNTYWAAANYEAAERQLRAALAAFEGAPGEDAAAVAVMADLGLLLAETNRFEEAEAMFRAQHDAALARLGPEHVQTVKGLGSLAGVLADQRKLAEAESVLALALPHSARFTGKYADVHRSNLNTLGGLRFFRGDLPGAEAALREAAEVSRRVYGPAHPSTIAMLESVAAVLGQGGDVAGEEAALEQVLSLYRQAFGAEHPRVAAATNSLGMALFRQGDAAAAEPLIREALAMNRRVSGSEHRETARSLNDLAQVLRAQGRLAEAEPLYVESLGIHERVFREDSPGVAIVLRNLGRLRVQQARYAEAEALLVRAIGIQRAALGDEHAATKATARELVALGKAWGRAELAETWGGLAGT